MAFTIKEERREKLLEETLNRLFVPADKEDSLALVVRGGVASYSITLQVYNAELYVADYVSSTGGLKWDKLPKAEETGEYNAAGRKVMQFTVETTEGATITQRVEPLELCENCSCYNSAGLVEYLEQGLSEEAFLLCEEAERLFIEALDYFKKLALLFDIKPAKEEEF